MPTYPVDEVNLRASDDPTLEVTVKLGNGPVTVTPSGYGGWEAVARPQRRALTVWKGRDVLRLSLPLLLDKFLEGREGAQVEDEIRVLEQMAGLGDSSDHEPPRLIVEGILPHDFSRASENRWVIETLEWGDAIRRMSDGQRVRQEVVLTLMEYTGADALRRLKGNAKPAYRYADVHKGDTLAKLAKREVGSAKWARRLGKLQAPPVRSVDVKLTRDRVRIPTGAALAKLKSKGG